VPSDRYEPVPGFAELPGWLWRRTSTALKVGAGVALVLVAAGAVATALSSNRDAQRARDEAAQRAAVVRREEVGKARAEQQPRLGRSRASGQTAMTADLSAAILADARGRVRAGELKGPILRVACARFPKTVGPPPREPDRRYSCVAVTAEIARSEGGEAGAIGHPYRAFMHFNSGRFAFCKISARLDPVKNPEVTTPSACGG
jgi:hypothetical protein